MNLQPIQNASTTSHLTEDQFGELLGRPVPRADHAVTPAEAHLLACPQCAAELAAMQNSLTLFRDATTNFAAEELRQLPRMTISPPRRILMPALRPALWLAAASLLLAAALPLQIARHHAHHPANIIAPAAAGSSTQSNSDEALLEDIDRDTSATVPASMQALADPTADASTSATGTSSQTSTQRN